MRVLVSYLAGVATGWALRSAVGSARGLIVSAVAIGLDAAERAKRVFAQEREFLEDLVAEGRARFETTRAANAPAPHEPPRAVA